MYILEAPSYFQKYSIAFNVGLSSEETDNDLSHVIKQTLCLGSVAGYLAEHLVGECLKEHVESAPANTRGFDLITKKGDRQIEVKSLTKYGAKLCQSSNIGAGRKIDHDLFANEAAQKDFIIADTRKLSEGQLEFVILPGSTICELGPKVSTNRYSGLFDETSPITVKWNGG